MLRRLVCDTRPCVTLLAAARGFLAALTRFDLCSARMYVNFGLPPLSDRDADTPPPLTKGATVSATSTAFSRCDSQPVLSLPLSSPLADSSLFASHSNFSRPTAPSSKHPTRGSSARTLGRSPASMSLTRSASTARPRRLTAPRAVVSGTEARKFSPSLTICRSRVRQAHLLLLWEATG
jgi:hypothetical protein